MLFPREVGDTFRVFILTLTPKAHGGMSRLPEALALQRHRGKDHSVWEAHSRQVPL